MKLDQSRLPMTVSDVAAVLAVSPKRVRRWVRDGHLTAKMGAPPSRQRGRQRVMLIVAGQPPLTLQRWVSEARRAAAPLRPGTWGIADNGRFEAITPDLRRLTINRPEHLDEAVAALELIMSLISPPLKRQDRASGRKRGLHNRHHPAARGSKYA